MSINERAQKNAGALTGYNEILRKGFESGYALGATEQHKIDEGFVIEWLMDNYSKYYANGGCVIEALIQDLTKAMGELK